MTTQKIISSRTVKTSPLAPLSQSREKQQVASTEFIESFDMENGVQISIKKGHALDYAFKRSSQLAALLNLQALVDGVESQLDRAIQSDVHWLAISMAEELTCLIDVVAADATQIARTSQGDQQ